MYTTSKQLKGLKVKQSMNLTGTSYRQRNALYQVAYRLGITITIRRTPEGVKLWRLT